MSVAAMLLHMEKNLESFGGHLECTVCGHKKPLGRTSVYLAQGWPKHCGYTMTWITARQEAES